MYENPGLHFKIITFSRLFIAAKPRGYGSLTTRLCLKLVLAAQIQKLDADTYTNLTYKEAPSKGRHDGRTELIDRLTVTGLKASGFFKAVTAI